MTVLAVLAALGAASVALAQKGPPKNPITVFSFGVPEGFAAPDGYDPASLLRLNIISRLEQTANYQPMEFSRRVPSVQLAVEQGRLQLQDLQPPFNQPEGQSWRAVVVGKQLRTPFALAGSIESYQYDSQKHTGTIVVSVDVYDVNENKVVVSAAVTGKAQGNSESEEVAVMSLAISDAADKVMSQISEPLGIGKKQSILDQNPEKKSQIRSSTTKTLYALTAVGVLIAIIAMRSRD